MIMKHSLTVNTRLKPDKSGQMLPTEGKTMAQSCSIRVNLKGPSALPSPVHWVARWREKKRDVSNTERRRGTYSHWPIMQTDLFTKPCHHIAFTPVNQLTPAERVSQAQQQSQCPGGNTAETWSAGVVESLSSEKLSQVRLPEWIYCISLRLQHCVER